jgi:uncharacterized membrane protein YhaH (DUF805 family)
MKKEKLWFKAKQYGWGWYPITWQGWIITLAFILFVTCMATIFLTKGRLMEYFLSLIISMVILIIICYLKGEKPEWRWGEKKRGRN